MNKINSCFNPVLSSDLLACKFVLMFSVIVSIPLFYFHLRSPLCEFTNQKGFSLDSFFSPNVSVPLLPFSLGADKRLVGFFLFISSLLLLPFSPPWIGVWLFSLGQVYLFIFLWNYHVSSIFLQQVLFTSVPFYFPLYPPHLLKSIFILPQNFNLLPFLYIQ